LPPTPSDPTVGRFRLAGQTDVMFKRKKQPEEPPPCAGPNETFLSLRAMAFEASANGLVPPRSDYPDVSGVVVDIPSQGGFVTIVARADDTTSMYTSVGGGTIGAGQHAAVAAATQQLLSDVQVNLGLFSSMDDQQLPPPGLVRIHVLTRSFARRADLPEGAFWGNQNHELMEVIVRVQTVIAAIRGASPK
jgi:hypothetical protein